VCVVVRWRHKGDIQQRQMSRVFASTSTSIDRDAVRRGQSTTRRVAQCCRRRSFRYFIIIIIRKLITRAMSEYMICDLFWPRVALSFDLLTPKNLIVLCPFIVNGVDHYASIGIKIRSFVLVDQPNLEKSSRYFFQASLVNSRHPCWMYPL